MNKTQIAALAYLTSVIFYVDSHSTFNAVIVWICFGALWWSYRSQGK